MPKKRSSVFSPLVAKDPKTAPGAKRQPGISPPTGGGARARKQLTAGACTYSSNWIALSQVCYYMYEAS